MSYQLLGATGRVRSLEAAWQDVDVSAMIIKDILQVYKGIYLELSHFAYSHPVFLKLHSISDTFNSTTLLMTPQQWLDSIGNMTLPVIEELPNPREQWAKYEDAFKAGYDVELINIGQHVDMSLPADDKRDLFLTKPTVNFQQFWRYFLISVNGFFHRSVLGPNGLYVIDGGRTRSISGESIAGITSFREVAKMEQIPITPSMITPVTEGAQLYNGFFLTLPQNIENKTVLLVVGGYLHILDSTYSVTGERTLKVEYQKLNPVDRYYDSLGQINLATLPILNTPENPKRIVTESFYSDAYVKAWMSLPQSFVIVLDVEDVYLRKYDVNNTRLPGVYQVEKPFRRLPLFGTYGRVLDYISYVEDEKVVMNSHYVNEPHRMYRTAEWRASLSIDDTCYTASPWRIAEAKLVEFGKFL